ncbi:MAG: DUF1415 domain-containing protein [Bacteroidota bacterium]
MKPVIITQQWIKSFVLQLNFCPFAKLPFEENRIHYLLEYREEEEQIYTRLVEEMQYLLHDNSFETSLIILPNALKSFQAYLDFLVVAEQLVNTLGFEGIFQIASFHPAYQFAGTAPEDVENYTNRSPYPMLHILREKSVTWAIHHHPDATQIPQQNIARLEALGKEAIKKRWNELRAKN